MLHRSGYVGPEAVSAHHEDPYTYRFGIEPSTWPSAVERLVVEASDAIYTVPIMVLSKGVSAYSDLMFSQMMDNLNAYASFTACDWGQQLLAGAEARTIKDHQADLTEDEIFPGVESPVMLFAEKGDMVRLRGRLRETRPSQHNLTLSSDELASFVYEEDDE